MQPQETSKNSYATTLINRFLNPSSTWILFCCLAVVPFLLTVDVKVAACWINGLGLVQRVLKGQLWHYGPLGPLL